MRTGVTLIELLVTIAIFSLIIGLSSVSYRNWQRNVQIANAADELRSTLKRAQQQSISASQAEPWGVHLEADEYVLFRGSFYDQADPNNLAREFQGAQILNYDSSITDGAGGYTTNIVFNKLSGQTINTGAIVVAALYDSSVTRSIVIQASGIIE